MLVVKPVRWLQLTDRRPQVQPSPVSLDSAEEELGSVGVGSSVGHGQDAGSSVLVDAVWTNMSKLHNRGQS